MSLYTVYFSPTGNTEKYVKVAAVAIAEYVAVEKGQEVDKAQAIGVYDCTCVREESGLAKYISKANMVKDFNENNKK